MSVKRGLGVGVGVGVGVFFSFSFFCNCNFCFFLPFFLLFCFVFCCLFFFMIIMAILNGSGQIVKYALSIINGHVINHHFSHVGGTNSIMEGGGGVHSCSGIC